MYKDLDVLGEPSVYPGHPITIAYLITQAYKTYEEAVKPDPEHGWADALRNCDIPGAGGCVHSAVSLLNKLHNGMPVEQAFQWADEIWGCTDNQNTRDVKNWKAGLEQAAKVKPLLAAASDWWLPKQ